MSMTIGNQRGPNRREYLIGCALQAVIGTTGSDVKPDMIATRAIKIGNAVDAQLQAEYEAAEAKTAGNSAG